MSVYDEFLARKESGSQDLVVMPGASVNVYTPGEEVSYEVKTTTTGSGSGTTVSVADSSSLTVGDLISILDQSGTILDIPTSLTIELDVSVTWTAGNEVRKTAGTGTVVPCYTTANFAASGDTVEIAGQVGEIQSKTASAITLDVSVTWAQGENVLKTSSPASIFRDPLSSVSITQPLTSTADGRAKFYAASRDFDVKATLAGSSVIFRRSNQGYLERFNILDYGADRTGSVSSVTALDAAIDAAEVVGGQVYLPNGTYLIDARVDIEGSCSIVGESWGAVLQCGGANIVLFADRPTTPIDVYLNNFTVDGNNDGQLDAGLVQFNDKVNYGLERLHIKDGGDEGDSPQGVNGFANGGLDQESYGYVRDCLFTGHDKPAIYINTGGNHVAIENNNINNILGAVSQGIAIAGAKNVVCHGNHIYDVGGSAIVVDPAGGQSPSRVVVTDNICLNCGDDVLSVSSNHAIHVARDPADPTDADYIVSDNIVTGCGINASSGGQGIAVQQQSRTIITNNIVRGNGTHGILIDSENDAAAGRHLKVSGNQCSNNNQNGLSNVAGIAVRECDGAQLSGNRCWDDQGVKTQNYGLFFADTVSANCYISANVLYGNLTGAIAWDTFPSGSLFVGNIETEADQVFGVYGDASPEVRVGEGKDAQAHGSFLHADVATGLTRLRSLADDSGVATLELDALIRDGSSDATIALHKGANTTGLILTSFSGQNTSAWNHYAFTETIDLTGATNDGSASGLPADSIIEAVVVRVTTAPDAGTGLDIGDQTPALTRFATGVAVALGTTNVCLDHVDAAAANGAATGIRITVTGGVPTSGQVRVVVFYRRFTPPQS